MFYDKRLSLFRYLHLAIRRHNRAMVQQSRSGLAGASGNPGSTMQAKIRCRGMEVTGIAVQDLSPAGCMIGTGSWLPREEQRVLVSLPGMPNLPGVVLWVASGRAGLLFDELLSEVMYEHLVGNFALAPAS